MNDSVKGAAKRLLFSLSILSMLGGCAVYDAGYGYPYYSEPAYPVAPVYGYGPAPLYTPPVYVPPPVFRFDYRSGGHRWDHGRRGWGDGGHGWRHNGGHRWRDGGHGPRVQPGMRGDGRWRAPGEGSGRR